MFSHFDEGGRATAESTPQNHHCGFVSLGEMPFQKHGHAGDEIEAELGEVLSCIGKGCSAN